MPVDHQSLLCTYVVRESVSGEPWGDNNGQCSYRKFYGNRFLTKGNAFHTLLRFQTETGAYVGFQRFVFGCSRTYEGTIDNPGASGILGFGRSPGSFVSQMSNIIDGRFGYCLVPIWRSDIYSELKFGLNAVIKGPDVISTPLITRKPKDIYFISLEAITVGQKKIPFIAGVMMVNLIYSYFINYINILF